MLEEPQIENRLIVVQLAEDERNQTHHRGDRHHDDEGACEPVRAFAAVHGDLERAEAGSDEQEAPAVEAQPFGEPLLAFLAQLRGLVHEGLHEQQRDDADRHIDEEDPVPRESVGDHAAE